MPFTERTLIRTRIRRQRDANRRAAVAAVRERQLSVQGARTLGELVERTAPPLPRRVVLDACLQRPVRLLADDDGDSLRWPAPDRLVQGFTNDLVQSCLGLFGKLLARV